MSRRLLLMLLAFVMGFVFSAGFEALLATPGSHRRTDEMSQRPRSSAAVPMQTFPERHAAEGAAKASTQPGLEVKTADESEFAVEKYTDGQAPANSAAVSAAKAVSGKTPAVEPSEAVGPEPAVAAAESAGEPAAPTLHPTAAVPHEPVAQPVFTDYRAAMREAAEDRKMLFIYFREGRANAAQRAFEALTLADREITEKLHRYVLLRLPRDASIVQDGRRVKLLDHPAFSEMRGRQGVAIIDLAHERADYYGHVVSTFPFTPGKYYRKEAMSIILDLPPGTLTQRTMIYAVRIHPEGPASTQGIFHTALADEAKEHADYQASILLQGHHSWDTRFQRINAKLGVVAQEVVAESWPNEGLVEACVDCVHSWRQSPGHWGAVRGRQPLFGYDIKRGRNGVWYATGIFGRLFGRN